MNEHLHADGSGRLRHLLSVQCELNALSDRQGLPVLALTGAAIRFQAYLLGWAVYFGAIEHVPGEGDVVVIPTPGRRHHIAQAISVSAVTLNKLFVTLMSPNHYERSGEFIRFRASVLQEAHDWMRHSDGDIDIKRPKRVEEFLWRAQGGDYE